MLNKKESHFFSLLLLRMRFADAKWNLFIKETKTINTKRAEKISHIQDHPPKYN